MATMLTPLLTLFLLSLLIAHLPGVLSLSIPHLPPGLRPTPKLPPGFRRPPTLPPGFRRPPRRPHLHLHPPPPPHRQPHRHLHQHPAPHTDTHTEASAAWVILYNNCAHPVWPGIQPSAGKPLLARGGFNLPPNKAYSLKLPPLWSGRFWGRHGCSFDAYGRGRCATGDCGGSLFCNGIGGTPPATLAEFNLGIDQDSYNVSLVDGYNLPISITPFNGSGTCSYAGCVSDLNLMCPEGLQVRSHDERVVACKSACSKASYRITFCPRRHMFTDLAV